MTRTLALSVDSFPIAGTFTISRGAKTTADVIMVTITEAGCQGRGECVPYRRYGETLDSVADQIRLVAPLIEAGMDRSALQDAMPPGAARNAVDCALFDLEAKRSGTSIARMIGLAAPRELVTAYTISLGEPQRMQADAEAWAHRALLKVKVGTADDRTRIEAVRRGAPQSRIMLDANEGWTPDNLATHLQIAADCGVELVEQPLPANADHALATVRRPIAVCADESVHDRHGLAALTDRYDAINIKLDKTGGLTEALILKDEAQRLGFRIMVGCMVGTSLGMAPAVLLAQGVDWVDLDGPLLLARDREPGLAYRDSLVAPPLPALWG